MSKAPPAVSIAKKLLSPQPSADAPITQQVCIGDWAGRRYKSKNTVKDKVGMCLYFPGTYKGDR